MAVTRRCVSCCD